MNVIEVSNLTKRYRRLTAVNDMSFAVERGQVFGFLGPNGSGKTTTIGMLLETLSCSQRTVMVIMTIPGETA